MAEDSQVEQARLLIQWPYEDVEPIRLALTAGDSESEDREGNRMLAQYGDRLVPFILATIHFQLGVSRQDQYTTRILIQRKEECARRARMCNLDRLVKISIRQSGDAPSATVLKNAMFALIAAVWLQASDWSHTLAAMVNLGLLCRRDSFISPCQLMAAGSPIDLFGVAEAYCVRMAEESAEQQTPHSNNGANHIAWNEDTHFGEHDTSPMELEYAISSVTTTLTLAPPSNIENHWFTSQVDFSGDMLGTIDQSNFVSGDGYLEIGIWGHQPHTHSSSRTESVAPGGAPEHEHITPGNGTYPSLERYSQTAFRVVDDTGVNPSDNALAAINVLGSEYVTAISALHRKHHGTLIQLILYIGSSSAVLSLRLILGNFRALHLNGMGKENARRIATTRSSVERLAAIDDLSACMAHFTLAQRMHIYMLYEEAVVEGGQSSEARNGHDSFILETGVSCVRSRGNPKHLHAAATARKMAAPGQSEARTKILRRVGRRLAMLVRKFGRGMLALLDEKLTHEMILKVADSVFTDFVAVIDRFEGARIRLISEYVCPIVDMLFDDGDDHHATTFQIENIEDDRTISQAARCSLELAMMLLPQTETDDSADT